MINTIGTIALYVESQEAAKQFWCEQAGFAVIAEYPMGPETTWLEVAPSATSETRMVLYPKAMMQEQADGLSTATPSLVFYSNDMQTCYNNFKANNIQVSEMQTMPFGTMMHFTDNEGNLFLVKGE